MHDTSTAPSRSSSARRTGHSPPGPGPVPPPAVTVDGLLKRYRGSTVVDRIGFEVNAGELFGLIGSNGAGKTTTVEILQGLRRADAGTVRVLGLDPLRDGDRLRRSIGSQLQAASLPGRLRVGEALRFFAGLHPDPVPPAEVAEQWQLGHLERRPCERLSGGERQRLFVALALIGRPRLVFLDELTQNLDPVGRRATWELVRRVHAAGTTVVLVTHDIEEAERLCQRVALLHRGRLVACGPPATVGADDGATSRVLFSDPSIRLSDLAGLPGATGIERRAATVAVEGTGPLLAHVGHRLVELGLPATDLRVESRSLEERFVELTSTAMSTTEPIGSAC